MKKVICCPASKLPDALDPEVIYFSLYSYPSLRSAGVGHIAPMLSKDIRRQGLEPSVEAWDFTTFALSVAAADKAVLRKNSADGWTRTIELSVHLQQPTVWNMNRDELEFILRFLTGDFWTLRFLPGGVTPPKANEKKQIDTDCCCLLSGGVDSLVGAIDLTVAGKKPFFISQIVRGDRETQKKFAIELGGENRHCQWSCTIKHPGQSEKSTRARSIIFFAYALLAASSIPSTHERPVDIFVPENGFISLNIPLGPGRIGSFSTKTTHPIYIAGLQSIWDALGIHAKLIQPYQYKTKGELISECANQAMLMKLIGDSTSCGKYQRYNLTHCGVCVPCMVRRAAFLRARLTDTTVKGYHYEQFAHSNSRDVSAAASTYLQYRNKGIQSLTRGNLSFASINDRAQYENVVARGIDELGQLLSSQGII